MAKAKKGDATQHLINDHFLPHWQDNRSNTLAAHQELHGGASQYPLPGHTHDVVGRSTYSEAKPREGYSQGAMANQELGKDRRDKGHPANTERSRELARRANPGAANLNVHDEAPSDYEVASKTNPYSKPLVLGKSGREYPVHTPPEPSTERSDQERRY